MPSTNSARASNCSSPRIRGPHSNREAHRREQVIDSPTGRPGRGRGGRRRSISGAWSGIPSSRHVFQLKNVGASDLTLESGRTTCKCTVSKISLDTVPPGEISEITVEWTGQTMSSEPRFRPDRRSENQRSRPPDGRSLRIKGYVTETIRALPDELVVGNVSSNTGSEAEFRLFGFRNDRMEILETTWEISGDGGVFRRVLRTAGLGRGREGKRGDLRAVGKSDDKTWVATRADKPDNSHQGERGQRGGRGDACHRADPVRYPHCLVRPSSIE